MEIADIQDFKIYRDISRVSPDKNKLLKENNIDTLVKLFNIINASDVLPQKRLRSDFIQIAQNRV